MITSNRNLPQMRTTMKLKVTAYERIPAHQQMMRAQRTVGIEKAHLAPEDGEPH
jgi:hypothetical protein